MMAGDALISDGVDVGRDGGWIIVGGTTDAPSRCAKFGIDTPGTLARFCDNRRGSTSAKTSIWFASACSILRRLQHGGPMFDTLAHVELSTR